MFEKEAEEYATRPILYGTHTWKDEEKAFKDGAEFGYYKAKVEVEESYRESLCNAELNLASVNEQLEELEKANELLKILLRQCYKYHLHPEVFEYPYDKVEKFFKEGGLC